jgi:mRNA interferase HigB
MVIISKKILNEFVERHPDAKNAVENWYDNTKAADWKSYNLVTKTFNSADSVGNDRFVFDIMGNHYRLIALIIFKVRTVFILFIDTHAAYDKVDASKVVFKK